MRTKQILIVAAIAVCQVVGAQTWTKNTPPSYYVTGKVYNTGSEVRYLPNSNDFPISYTQVTHSALAAQTVYGSSNTAPPWSSPFATLYNIENSWFTDYSGPGTVPAKNMHVYYWEWKADEGIEEWTDGSTTVRRTKNFTYNFEIKYRVENAPIE